jgi:hypothetical protein
VLDWRRRLGWAHDLTADVAHEARELLAAGVQERDTLGECVQFHLQRVCEASALLA